jgi:hypothetical protein
MHTIVGIALALTVGAQSVSGEWESLRPFVGAQVVVRDAIDGSISGRLRDLTADALTLEIYAETRSVVKSRTCEVDIVERDRSAAIGWIVGLALGGLVVGIVASKTREGAPNPALFTAIGASIGTVKGMTGTTRRAIYRHVDGSIRCHG